MAIVRVGDIELDCERSGSGPPLLMLMGMGGSSLTWGEPFLQALRSDFEVIVYDHRGIGASTRLEGPITILEMAQDAAGLLGALGIERADVLGISMGGMVAQELALGRPELVRTLSLGCTYCGGEGSVQMSREVSDRITTARRSGDRERAIRTSWQVNVSPRFAADEAAFSRYREIALTRAAALPVIEAQGRAISGHDTSQRLGELALPTLVMHGTLDQILPVANGRMVAGLIAGSELEIFEDVGHLFFWEQPQRAAELVRANAAVHV